MKRIAAAGFISLLAIAPCAAEPTPGGPPNPAPGITDGNRPDGPRRGPPDADREGGWRHHPPMPGVRGAHLRLRKGETGIDFKCAADDSTKACVDALMPLVDKLLQAR